MDAARACYSGPSQKLVVALDIGTTFSGAAYAFLDPGVVPEIRSVTKYLNNPNVGSAKVPSAMYYNLDGGFCRVENGVDYMDSNVLLKMKWWKLMLSPAELPAATKVHMDLKLPKGKTIVDVFADFMRYLFDSTKAVFKASESDGKARWDSVSNDIELVLTHPNGWGGRQQTQLRSAAIRAGIIPDTPAGHSRVSFATEGEASFSFCVTHTHAGKNITPGERVLIVDAGGGTIDISSYKILSNGPLQVEELYETKSLLQGGEIVTARARAMIEERLRGSRFDTPKVLALVSQKFDEGLKRVFSNNYGAECGVSFGTPRDNDLGRGIKNGRLTLTGTQVAAFFEPSVQSTMDAIRDNYRQRLPVDSSAFLVGGFAASPRFSGQLQKQLLGIGFQFCKPDMHTNKAVAVGAVSYYIDHLVAATVGVSRFTYGVSGDILYNPSNPEHVRRVHESFVNPMGEKRVPGYYVTMLSRGTEIVEDREIRYGSYLSSESVPPRHASSRIVKYTGTLRAPEWEDVETDKFQMLCHVTADLSTAPYTSSFTPAGKICHKRAFDVVLLVGATGLKAQISWVDSATGTERRFVIRFSEFVFPGLDPVLGVMLWLSKTIHRR